MPPPPIDNGTAIAQFIRAEIRSAVQDEIRQVNSDSAAPPPSYAPPSPSLDNPSNAQTIPLLSLNDRPVPESTYAHPSSSSSPYRPSPSNPDSKSVPEPDIEAQTQRDSSGSPATEDTAADTPASSPGDEYAYEDFKPRKTLAQSLGLIVVWFPLCAWIGLVAGLTQGKVVPAGIAGLSAILAAIMYGLGIFLSIVIFIIHNPEKPTPAVPASGNNAEDSTSTIQKAKEKARIYKATKDDNIAVGSLFTWHFFLLTCLYCVIIYVWFCKDGPSSIYGKSDLVDAFEDRLKLVQLGAGGKGGFKELISCIEETAGHVRGQVNSRVTRKVVDDCLKRLGVS